MKKNQISNYFILMGSGLLKHLVLWRSNLFYVSNIKRMFTFEVVLVLCFAHVIFTGVIRRALIHLYPDVNVSKQITMVLITHKLTDTLFIVGGTLRYH